MRKKKVGNLFLAEGNVSCVCRDAMPGKVCHTFRGDCVPAHMTLSIRINCQQRDSLGCPEQRYRVADGPSGFAVAVPCHKDIPTEIDRHPDMGIEPHAVYFGGSLRRRPDQGLRAGFFVPVFGLFGSLPEDNTG
jgi:hypothetical protein